MSKSIASFVENQIEGLSHAERMALIEDYIQELKELRGMYLEGSYQEYQKRLKEEISRFFEDISALSVAEKVVLRRDLGVKNDLEGMFRILSNVDKYPSLNKNRKIWALCARIYCYCGCNQSENTFASVLGTEINSNSGIARFENLLESSEDKFEYFSGDIVRFVRQLKSKGKYFNCEKMLFDLLNWNNKNKSTQMAWARDFYSSNEKE